MYYCSACSPSTDDSKLLQVTILTPPLVPATLGGSLTLPCLVSLAQPPPTASTNGRHAVLLLPRVKWSVLSEGRDTEILVARGDRVRVSEAYRGRASLLRYAVSPVDLSLRLDGVRYNDTGFYRCEVQQGLEDAHDAVQVKVKGEGSVRVRASRQVAGSSPNPSSTSLERENPQPLSEFAVSLETNSSKVRTVNLFNNFLVLSKATYSHLFSVHGFNGKVRAMTRC